MNIRCYDNGGLDRKGGTVDRYTVVYLDQPGWSPGCFTCVGMSGEPFHPQGIGQHSEAKLGRHLGRWIEFEDLPQDCKKLVKMDLGEVPEGCLEVSA
jgi:hypothetical protein